MPQTRIIATPAILQFAALVNMSHTSCAAFLTKRKLFFGGGILLVALLSIWQYPLSLGSIGSIGNGPIWRDQQASAGIHSKSQTRHRVAVASQFGFHHDVYMALVWTLERVMRHSGRSVEVYASSPFGFDFQDIVDELGLYHGVVQNPDDLISNITYEAGEGGIDMVILGTCEIDLRGDWHQELLSAWDARDEKYKFQLVCIAHHVQDLTWQSSITEWSRRGAIRIVTISEHVARGFRRSFNEIADSLDPILRSAGYEHIPVDVYVPVLDIPDLPEPSSRRVLSKAVIQGTFSVDRRDYTHIFSELNDSLSQDPAAWGYLPLRDHPSYIVDSSLPDPPFHLYLIGSGYLEVPLELTNVVSLHVDSSYSQFYTFMGEMDVCLPAFAENGYYELQASSTFAMAVECNVPILVTRRMRDSYTYMDDDRVVITRPAAMREVAAIRALRTGDASYFLDTDISGEGLPTSANTDIRDAVQKMMRPGWTRSKGEFQAFKKRIWSANELLVERLLMDL